MRRRGVERGASERTIEGCFLCLTRSSSLFNLLTRSSAVQISLRQFSTASSSAAPSPAPMRARALPMDWPSSLRTCIGFVRFYCFFLGGGRRGRGRYRARRAQRDTERVEELSLERRREGGEGAAGKGAGRERRPMAIEIERGRGASASSLVSLSHSFARERRSTFPLQRRERKQRRAPPYHGRSGTGGEKKGKGKREEKRGAVGIGAAPPFFSFARLWL